MKNQKIKILVVEDEPAIREICRRVLTREGYEVTVAEDGRQAQEIISSEDFTLYLIDIRTPVVDGQELYVWILQEKPGAAGGVIFTTGDLMEGQMLEFLRQAKKPLLPKPFSGVELRAIVKKTLGNKGK